MEEQGGRSGPSPAEAWQRTAWRQWLDQHRRSLQATSVWQLRFAETVLALTPGLNPAWVFPEYPFTDAAGRARRMDFAVRRPDGDFLAIEVDGYDKTGTGLGMTREEFEDFLRRQNSLVNQGWILLRFSNRDVRDDPASCRRELAAALQRGTAEPITPPKPVAPPRHEPAAAPVATAREPRRPVAAMAWAAGGVAALAAAALLFVAGADDDGSGEGRAEPLTGGACPAGFPLKANDESGIFHSPGQRYYDETRAEACFADAASAATAGFRASKI